MGKIMIFMPLIRQFFYNFTKQLKLFQNFSFWNSFLKNLVEKPGFDRFFRELVPKPTGFWNKLNRVMSSRRMWRRRGLG
jgi:hypothetical protein